MSNTFKWGIIIAVLLLLVSTSFGAGYLIAKQANPAPIIIQKCSDIGN